MADIDINLYENSLPDSLKLTGSQKLGQLILEKGLYIGDFIQPQLDKLIEQLKTPNELCLPGNQLSIIIDKRNNIVTQLNKIEKKINLISESLGITSEILENLIKTVNNIELSSNVANIAQSTSPVATGQITSLIFTLNNLINNIKFDKLGNPNLNKLQNIIDYTAAPINITSDFISKAIITIKAIDIILNKCEPNASIEPISNNLLLLTEKQIKSLETPNKTTYKGFIIEIQEIPFSPTVMRRKAIGKNSQGIPLIETQLSFTTNSQTLTNELKLIIDKNNLKAY